MAYCLINEDIFCKEVKFVENYCLVNVILLWFGWIDTNVSVEFSAYIFRIEV